MLPSWRVCKSPFPPRRCFAMFRREAPSLPFLDSSVGVHGGRRARRIPPMSSLGLGLCLLSFQWGIHFRAGAAAHVFLRIHRCGLLGARPPCLGLGDPGPSFSLQGRQGSRGCIPDSPGESGLIWKGMNGLRSPLESRRVSFGAQEWPMFQPLCVKE